jgi:hypothetical protein
MKNTAALVLILFCAFASLFSLAHPGSGIVVDRTGNIYFTDTGKGVWKLERDGKLSYIPASRFHWMAIDPSGYFARTPKSFGGYFERVMEENTKPGLVMCSDFPLAINKDGNIYYVNTRHTSTSIVRRTPAGKESALVTDKILEFASDIAAGADSSIYITESSNPNGNTIRKITINGKMSILATFTGTKVKDPPLETVPAFCRGLAVDEKGFVFVAATGSRSVLEISPKGQIRNILQERAPWTPTGIAVSNGEVYILEWHDVAPADLEVRIAYIPRVRKIGKDGKVQTLATISR